MKHANTKMILAVAPGRVNLLGEHVDYNEGPVLPVAIDRTVRVLAAPQAGDIVSLQALDLHQEAAFRLDGLERKQSLNGEALPSWALYPAGVAWALQLHGYTVSGLQATYQSNLPMRAGLSSSAAVETAFAVLWQQLGGWEIDRMALAQICRQAEVEFVGLHCGLMDQFASAHGVAGHVLSFDTRTLAWEAIPLPDVALVIANSGVPRQLSESAYNERRATCQQAVVLLKQVLPEIQALRDVSVADFNRFASRLPEVAQKRARHVIEECERVRWAVHCLKRGDLHSFGRLMLQGHASLRDLFEVSCPELDVLVEVASRLPGCLGARLTGAGFGGSTINLVEWDDVDDFIVRLKTAYKARCDREADMFVTCAARGAWVEQTD